LVDQWLGTPQNASEIEIYLQAQYLTSISRKPKYLNHLEESLAGKLTVSL